MPKPVVGNNVDSWCTRCKLILAHTIEAVSGNRITRVHCNTCDSQHAYRPNPPGSSRSRSTASARKQSESSDTDDFESLMRGKNPATARRYSPAERFAAGELLRHAQFGLGVVRKVREQDKLEVVFTDSVRTLIHGRSR